MGVDAPNYSKKCSKCKETKLYTEFHSDKYKKTGLASTCKVCSNERVRDYVNNNLEDVRQKAKVRQKIYYKANKEKCLAGSKKWLKANPEKSRINSNKQNFKKFNMTYEQIEELRNKIDNRCQSCGSKSKLQADHDHETNKFRGLICKNCNSALGFAKDNTSILQSLIYYLNKNMN